MRCGVRGLRSKWSGIAALTEIAGFPQPPGAPGAGMGERDLLAVPQARHSLQRDDGPLLRGLLPPDPQELRQWLHRFTPAAQNCWAARRRWTPMRMCR